MNRSYLRVAVAPFAVVVCAAALLSASAGAAIRSDSVDSVQLRKPAPHSLASLEIRKIVTSEHVVSSIGGTLNVVVHVQGALRCRILPTSRHGAAVSLKEAWRNCSAGVLRVSIVFGPSATSSSQSHGFLVFARSAHKTAHAVFAVREAGTAFSTNPNWAGYVWQSSTAVQGVSATWTVPTVGCASATTYLEAWVGVDGGTSSGPGSNEVFQTGSQSSCSQRSQSDTLWWDWFPEQQPITVGTANPGDTIAADVYYAQTNGQSGWWWSIEDLTTGQSYTNANDQPIAYDGPGATGEWVVEDPGAADSPVPFPSTFTPVTFTGMQLGPGGWSATARDAREIVQSGQVLAVPTVPNVSGGQGTMTVSP